MRWLITTLLLFFAMCPVGAVTIHVPVDQPTIQTGLNVASAGDTVLIACGTYYEYDIMMKSGVCLLSASGSPECVTIDGQQLGSVILCFDMDDTASIIGFTITGGLSPSSGGGIHLSSASPRIAHCDIIGNSAVLGGGIKNNNSSPTIEYCRILDNHALYDGAGACCTRGSPVFSHCLFAGNEAEIWGGGLELTSHPGTPMLSHCTIVDNSAGAWGGGIFSADQCQFILENTIIAFNRENGGIYIQDGLAYQRIQCCDVYGNLGGNYIGDLGDLTGIDGNISEHPLFCDADAGDFSLAAASPCLPEHNSCDALIGAFEQGCEIATAVDNASPGLKLTLDQNYPNPFNPTTEISFTLPEVATISLQVYDLSGRLVRSLVTDESYSSGIHHLTWSGAGDGGKQLVSGVYLYRLIAGDLIETKKLTLLR